MQQPNTPGEETRTLRDRLTRLSEASRRINESLDFDTVLQEVVDSARTLTEARYGAITVPGETGQRPDFIVSGLTREEHQGLWEMPGGLGFFEYLSGLRTPLRVSDIAGHLGALGMGEFTPPVPASSCWWRRSATWGPAWAPSTWPTRRRGGSSAGMTRRPW